MVNKYRDVIRMTLFGRHDKNLNDANSIYQGYDRYQQTTTGGGVTALNISVLSISGLNKPFNKTLTIESKMTAKVIVAIKVTQRATDFLFI